MIVVAGKWGVFSNKSKAIRLESIVDKAVEKLLFSEILAMCAEILKIDFYQEIEHVTIDT